MVIRLTVPDSYSSNTFIIVLFRIFVFCLVSYIRAGVGISIVKEGREGGMYIWREEETCGGREDGR